MSRLLMSAAIAALMSAPALAQADPAMAQAGNAQASTQPAGGAADWKTSHSWINAAVYDEAGDQVGIVNRVRLTGSGDVVRALVLDTDGFLDTGMRQISLLSDEATVITRDALPASWMMTRQGAGAPRASSDGEPTTERRWWEFGREDEGASGDSSAMPNFTLITLDFTADEIAMMPQFTAGSSGEVQPGPITASTASSASQGQADAAVGLASASDDERDAPQMSHDTAVSTASTVADDTDDDTMQSVEDGEADDDVAADESQNNGRGPSAASTDTPAAQVTDDQAEATVQVASETDDAASPDMPATSEPANPFTLAWTDIESAMDRRTGADRGEDGEASQTAEDGDNQTAMEETRPPYGAGSDDESSDDGESDSAEWTDQHDWVNTAVYSRSGEQIGEIERVRGGANAHHPSAIVLETGGFLEIGGREVQLSGANFRLTDYEGEQVLQIRYTGDEIMQMPTFNEADASDYLLSDNPLEADETETEADDDETGSGGTR